MSNIIGTGGSIHDFATCLILDKKIIAIEDERLTRVRYSPHSSSPCQPSLNYCLNAAGLSKDDISMVVTNDDLPELTNHFSSASKKSITNHHLAHAYSTFFTSNFEDAAILIIDGAGGKKDIGSESEVRETTTYAYGSRNNIKVIKKIYGDLSGDNPITNSQTVMSNSLGEFYRVIAETIELGWLSGPGKTMGLASYGAYNQDDRFVADIMDCVKFLSEGEFEIEVNGPNGLVDKLFLLRTNARKKEDYFKVDAAIAYAGQIVLEKILFHLLDYLASKVDSPNLCLAGGVALNSIANGKIPVLSKFKNVSIFFAPGDNGTAIGAAVSGYLSNNLEKELVRFPLTPFLGKTYSSIEIKDVLNIRNLTYTHPKNIYHETARLLAQGKIVAWYRGGSEFGPRALGHRSILADPRNPNVRDHINFMVKQREWFRPLAPAVLESAAKEYFDAVVPSPWMQFVWPVREQYYQLLPGITHIDGTARMQSVSELENPSFYKLIEAFANLTELPILLNTSFNTNGQPIVETPEEAIEAFLGSQIDVLVMEEFLVVK